MATTRDQMLSVVMLEKADQQIQHWFRRFERGMEALVKAEDAHLLIDYILLRDQLRGEVGGDQLPALVGIVDEE